jgi:hypothetical protein
VTSGKFEEEVGYESVEFRRVVWLGIINLRALSVM